MPLTTDQKAEQLHTQVDKFQIHHWKRQRKHTTMAISLLVFGLALNAGTTIAGICENKILAGIFGTATMAFIGLHNRFNFFEKSNFYGQIHAEAKTIRDILRYQVTSEDEFKQAFDSFQALRQKAEKPPEGKVTDVFGKDGG